MRHQRAVALDMPERPAVAGRRALDGGADLVDRALLAAMLDRGIGEDAGASSAAWRRSASCRARSAPLSTRVPNGTFGWVAREAITFIALSSSASVESIRVRATST